MRSADVRAALARKFAAPEYALFYEVGDATGGRSRRWADAIAMGLWPSRGLALQGFEIKVSRSDWLSEMRNPAKAEAIARFCAYWWIATPAGIVKDGELPEGWGLYEVQTNGLRCVKQAPKLEPQPIDMPFLAALLRRADEHAKATVHEAVQKQTEALRASVATQIKAGIEEERRHVRSQDEAARSTLEAIKKAAGIGPGEDTDGMLGRWFDEKSFGRAVGMVHRLGVAKTYGGLADVSKQLQPLLTMAGAIEPLLAAMRSDEDEAA